MVKKKGWSKRRLREVPLKEEGPVMKAIKQNKRETGRISNMVNQQGFVKYQAYVPEDEQMKIDQEWERVNNYINLKEEKIEKEFNGKLSSLKKVADYLYAKLYEFPMVSVVKAAKELGITKENVHNKISKLNFYSSYPITIIPVRNKRGFVQAITKSPEDGESWERKKFRTIESMTHIKEKGTAQMKRAMRHQRRKKVVKVRKTQKVAREDKNE